MKISSCPYCRSSLFITHICPREEHIAMQLGITITAGIARMRVTLHPTSIGTPDPDLQFTVSPLKRFCSSTNLSSPVCSTIYPQLWMRRDGFMPFPRALAQSEMHTALSKIWTQITKSIFSVSNHYTTPFLCIMEKCKNILSSLYINRQ